MGGFELSPLNQESNVPLYRQLKEQLLEGIRYNIFSSDCPLPKEVEIAESLNVSRSVVRQAILSLAKEGYLYRVPGKGTFMTDRTLEYDLLGFYDFRGEMKKQGKELTLEFISFELFPADMIFSALFSIPIGEMLVNVERVLLIDGHPIILERTTISEKTVHGITADEVSFSDYIDLFKKYGLRISRAKRYIEPAIANAYESKCLRMSEGMPVLLMDRYTYADGSDAVLTRCRWTVRGDRCRYYINLDSRT